MRMHVWIPICLLLSLTACGTERIIEKPVPVEIIRVEYVPVPADLLHGAQKQTIPETLTYGLGIELWAEDRSTIDILNAKLKAIQSLTTE